MGFSLCISSRNLSMARERYLESRLLFIFVSFIAINLTTIVTVIVREAKSVNLELELKCREMGKKKKAPFP